MNHAGYLRVADQEYDAVHCCHCQALLKVKSVMEGGVAKQVREGRWCPSCGKYRCSSKACQVCTPFMRKVDAKHKADRMFAAMGIGG
jgi:hypothetical protein